MQIYTSNGIHLSQISREIIEPQYVDNVPYSVQQKLNIKGNKICVQMYKKQPIVTVGCRMQVVGDKATRIIKVLNGYQKSNARYNRY